MTLNGLNGHFTLNFYYYGLTQRFITYLIIVESVYITREQRMCGSEVADRDPQNIRNPQKKNADFFVDATSSKP